MRAYFFNNQYLAGIHNGIQAGHALDQLWSNFVEMKKMSKANKAKFAMLRDFSKNHKTWIVLNAGDHDALGNLHTFMTGQNTYPVAMFQEPGLNFSNTSIVVILPERMYDDTARAVGKALLKAETNPTPFNLNLVAIMTDLGCEERNYTSWEREFLKRKELCSKAS